MELNLTKPIAFFDLETTGIKVATDRIVEIGILKIHPDGHHEIKTEKINPTIPISEEATFFHGITNEDVKDLPTFAEIAINLSQFLFGCDLAGYNVIRFDIPLLAEEFLRADIDFDVQGRRIIDVQNIFHKMEQRTLAAAYKFYCGNTLVNAHSAEADTLATYEVLKSQLDMYKEATFTDKYGKVSQPVVNDVAALHDFSFQTKHADLVGHIVYDDKDQEIFNFGKYKGQQVEEIFKKEPQYYDWMMKSQFPLYTKKVITAIKLRGFNKDSVSIR